MVEHEYTQGTFEGQAENSNRVYNAKFARPLTASLWCGDKNLTGDILLIPGKRIIGIHRVLPTGYQGGIYRTPTSVIVSSTSFGDSYIYGQLPDDLAYKSTFSFAEGKKRKKKKVSVSISGNSGIEVRFRKIKKAKRGLLLTIKGGENVLVKADKLKMLFPFGKFNKE